MRRDDLGSLDRGVTGNAAVFPVLNRRNGFGNESLAVAMHPRSTTPTLELQADKQSSAALAIRLCAQVPSLFQSDRLSQHKDVLKIVQRCTDIVYICSFFIFVSL